MRKLSNIVTRAREASLSLPSAVSIVEVGPRDGLQNEKEILPTEVKIEFINRLSECGFRSVEVTSFVSPKWVPQMGDNSSVYQGITKKPGVSYPVLTPNYKGYQSAKEAGCDEVAIFAAASESFSQRNINCSIKESLLRFQPIMSEAYREGVKVRGYVSCVLGCPYEGEIDPEAVRYVAKRLHDMGCYEVSLGDTIGIGTPQSTEDMLRAVLYDIPADKLAVHFHNTYGRALENILKACTMGISVIDSSVASLGGCPYAKGATGNVSSEDVVYLLEQLGVSTGVNLERLSETAEWICEQLARQNRSEYRRAEA